MERLDIQWINCEQCSKYLSKIVVVISIVVSSSNKSRGAINLSQLGAITTLPEIDIRATFDDEHGLHSSCDLSDLAFH